MRLVHVGALVRRRRKLLLDLAATATPSYANSTFTAASATGTADGSTPNTLTLTLYDTNGVVMSGEAVTFTTELTAVDAAETTLADDAAEIETTTGTLNLVLVCRNANGVPLPNIQSARIVFASTGSNNTFGTPTVTNRNGRSLCTFSSTTAEAKTISVTVDGIAITATCAVTVTSPAGQPAFVMTADWRTATGTSDAALRDTDQVVPFTTTGGGGLEVIASTGLDFPTTNVLRVTSEAATTGFGTVRVTGLGALSDGQTRYRRMYVRPMFPDGLEDNQTHPVQDGNPGSQINEMWSWFQTTDPRTSAALTAGHYLHAWQMHNNNNFFTQYRWYPPQMAKEETYRIEWAVARVSSTTFRLHVRIYDSANVLLYDDADFVNENASATLADDPLLLWNNAANVDGMNVGCNGIGGSAPPFPFVYAYFGGVAVSDDDWCGPYVAGESP